jgi:hypothetical protein
MLIKSPEFGIREDGRENRHVVSFIIDESHLRQLSPEARSELLQILGAEIADLKSEFADRSWDPEGNKSYPLSADEARVLIRGLGQSAKNLLRTFCLNYDGKIGSGELDELLHCAGIQGYEDLGHEVSVITQRMHSATGNPDAWLFNWHARDWHWDDEKNTYDGIGQSEN